MPETITWSPGAPLPSSCTRITGNSPAAPSPCPGHGRPDELPLPAGRCQASVTLRTWSPRGCNATSASGSVHGSTRRDLQSGAKRDLVAACRRDKESGRRARPRFGTGRSRNCRSRRHPPAGCRPARKYQVLSVGWLRSAAGTRLPGAGCCHCQHADFLLPPFKPTVVSRYQPALSINWPSMKYSAPPDRGQELAVVDIDLRKYTGRPPAIVLSAGAWMGPNRTVRAYRPTAGARHHGLGHRIVGQITILVHIHNELVVAPGVPFGFIQAKQEGWSGGGTGHAP